MIRRPPRSTRTDTLFPYRRSSDLVVQILIETGFAALRLVEKLKTIAPFDAMKFGKCMNGVPPHIAPLFRRKIDEPTFDIIVGLLRGGAAIDLPHDKKGSTKNCWILLHYNPGRTRNIALPTQSGHQL